ncbi:hypothetical protein NLU13_5842 [Sarocladium strictum]|uniref:PWI domain-containing protein n=1 Tax=Sarocladium strictum TaxID=5046 RepID=A0AA39GET1_SARSR|nr:hypothetical protein NLU13_5842 [Sarocladium strictum]
MAAIPPTRTRSLRATAPSLNRPQQHSTIANSTTTTARKAQAAGSETNTQGRSSLSLFLTNLRLLDLDLLPDWPGISPATFLVPGSGTGAAQAQKRRVACVEWALFRLFEIYDPEETRAKLKPFFPPQDQVQSINLRSALLRGLETAKKSGVLGKDAILRKTMLDDCRGERLEEVLAAFSTAVLKIVVAEEESIGSSTPIMRVALENRGYKDEKMDLVVLGLVHRAALSKGLRRRKDMTAKYRDFEDLLSVKERGLRRRKEEAKALDDVDRGQRGKTISEDAAKEMRHTVRNNWAGNEQWLDTLLYGDAKRPGDGNTLFGMPFERVWRRVEQSRLAELEEGGAGLLEQLERRVRGHEERLAKWESFRNALTRGQAGRPRGKEKAEEAQQGSTGLDLGFGAHESLQIGAHIEGTRGQASVRSTQLSATPKHDSFIVGLERDLEQASGEQSNPLETLGFLFDRRPTSFGEATQDATTAPPPTRIRTASSSRSTMYSRPRSISPDKHQQIAPPNPPATEEVASRRIEHQSQQEPLQATTVQPDEQAEIVSPTQDMADEILESMKNASPSPTKPSRPRHKLSLAERTRLSMARGSLLFADEEEEVNDSKNQNDPSPSEAPSDNVEEAEPSPIEDLVSRTRRSMAGFEKARQKAQLDRRRSIRKSKAVGPPIKEGSYFPKVQEEEETSVLAEELMAEEDMEAVFKSRPKIKASPLPSPTREQPESLRAGRRSRNCEANSRHAKCWRRTGAGTIVGAAWVGQSLARRKRRRQRAPEKMRLHPLPPRERSFLRSQPATSAMAYNQYGGPPYGAPPAYGGYPGASVPPGMGAPPGLAAAPGMSSAPGIAPPGIQQANAPQPNRPSGIPSNFQPPTNMPNINFNAPVIRLGTTSGKPSTPASGGRGDAPPREGGGRSGLGMERGGGEQGRDRGREQVPMLFPPTAEEKLRTIFLWEIPEGVGGDAGVEKLLRSIGNLRNWDAAASVMDDHKGVKFGFALYDDVDSLSMAVKLLYQEKIQVPVKRQTFKSEAPEDDTYDGIEKTELNVAVDESTLKYIEAHEEGKGDDDTDAPHRLEAARSALRKVVRQLFYPPAGAGADAEGDVAMGNNESGENVEVVNISLAQDDELADIPAEMREVVAKEIAAFRERSTQRDLERLKREEEMEEMERLRSGPRPSRLESPPPSNGQRGNVPNAPSGPRGQNGTNRGQAFVNGGVSNAEYSINQEDEDTGASDEELERRRKAKQKSEDEKRYMEAERKWTNRERSRQAALEREREREKQDAESLERRKQEQIDRDKTWDDKREAARKLHPYYRDHAAWIRKRNMDKVDEEARDDTDRRAEQGERRREEADVAKARGAADDFLDRQAQDMGARQPDPASAPQPFKLSLGAAAQKAQASRAGAQRRTIAEVEGLLDDEEADTGTKRQLIPIEFEPTSATASMSEEEISRAVRSLAAEIPSEKAGLWAWEVKWEFMDEGVVRDRLRPFVEKKIVEYLGVQEEMLVEAVEEHLKSHGSAAALVEELEGALDDEAEDLVKKLWRMVIFFTECEKRGLPA